MREETEPLQSENSTTQTPQWKFLPLVAMLWSFAIALVLAFTPLWQLSLAAGFIGGIICRKMKAGALVGLCGVALGWLVYMLLRFVTNQTYVLLDQIGNLLFGASGFGWVLVLLIALIGGLFGTLGGAIGSGTRILLEGRNARKARV
ncbi:MAG TPA: hypothetical protein VKK79_18210 [Candidatus Lokiarchaeia archaeon]|nr:hypothetical protein [Candidatus Lokiarchaeia archaeon]